VEKWLDLLTPSAAALSLLLGIALLIQSIRHGRALRRLESRLAEREGAAARVSLDRLQQLQRRPRTSSIAPDTGRGERRVPAATVGAAVAVAAVLAVGGWFLFLRGDDSGTAADSPSRGTTTTAATTPTTSIGATEVPENPEPLPESKAAYTILVLNGSGVTGAARSIVVPRVQELGWNTAPPDNASSSSEKTSFVIYLPGKEVVADNVAKDLGIRRKELPDGFAVSQDTSDVDAIVVVGQDLTTRLSP
jgi:hypothetical protein